MHDGVRRLSVLMIVCCAALVVTYWLRGTAPGYGLFQLLRGEIAPREETKPADEPAELEVPNNPDAFTPAKEAAVDLQDVKLLALLSREKANLAEAVVPSVVSIEMERPPTRRTVVPSPLFGGNATVIQRDREPGQGSGVIISEQGHIVTNHHVIDGAVDGSIRITTHDRQQYPVRVIGSDPVLDIAVLQVDAEPDLRFAPLSFGDSSKVRQGEMVFSVGSPFGLDGTFTDGIVSSAVPRRISDSVPPLIQTNTALNRGNSGGPLVNVQGKIIGINAAIYNDPNSFASPGGAYGLAIPSNEASQAIRDILSEGVPTYGYLGVYLKEIHPHEAIILGLRDAQGCLVNGTLAGSPAYQAGLQKDDVIVKYDGEPFKNVRELVDEIQDTSTGTEVTLTIVRERQEQELKAVIQQNGSVDVPEPDKEALQEAWDRAGLRVDYVAARERIDMRYQPYQPMVAVAEVRPGSPAAASHLHEGILIHEIDDVPIQTPKEFYELLRRSTGQVFVKISYPGRSGSIHVPIPLR